MAAHPGGRVRVAAAAAADGVRGARGPRRGLRVGHWMAVSTAAASRTAAVEVRGVAPPGDTADPRPLGGPWRTDPVPLRRSVDRRAVGAAVPAIRSEERRVGKVCGTGARAER